MCYGKMEPISPLQTWFSVTIHFFLSLTVCLPVCLQSYLSVYINYVSLLFRQCCGRCDGLMVSVLESRSGGLDSSTGRGTASCSWARHFTLMVPLSTQVATKLKCRLYPFLPIQPVYINRRLVSSVGRVLICCAGGRGFEPQT